MFLGGLIKNYK